MLMKIHHAPLALIVLLLIGNASASTINSATISGNQLTITGNGFGGVPLAVSFNGKSVPIVRSSSTQIVATLNPVPSSGSYRLVVKAGTSSTFAYVTTPAIFVQVTLNGQTGPIAPTTLFTPPSDGLYRISSYGVVTTPNATYGLWDVQLNWTDESGAELCSSFLACALMQLTSDPVETHFGGQVGLQGPYTPNNTAVIRVKAGTSVTYSVVADPSGNPSGSTYDLFITVEQLM